MMPSDRTIKNKKMIKSCGGVVPFCGNPIFILPEYPIPLGSAMSKPGSSAAIPHELSSINNVKKPPVAFKLVMVKVMGLGVGE